MSIRNYISRRGVMSIRNYISRRGVMPLLGTKLNGEESCLFWELNLKEWSHVSLCVYVCVCVCVFVVRAWLTWGSDIHLQPQTWPPYMVGMRRCWQRERGRERKWDGEFVVCYVDYATVNGVQVRPGWSHYIWCPWGWKGDIYIHTHTHTHTEWEDKKSQVWPQGNIKICYSEETLLLRYFLCPPSLYISLVPPLLSLLVAVVIHILVVVL